MGILPGNTLQQEVGEHCRQHWFADLHFKTFLRLGLRVRYFGIKCVALMSSKSVASSAHSVHVPGHRLPLIVRQVEIYDPRANAWREARPMAAPRAYAAAATVDGSVNALGGIQSPNVRSLDLLCMLYFSACVSNCADAQLYHTFKSLCLFGGFCRPRTTLWSATTLPTTCGCWRLRMGPSSAPSFLPASSTSSETKGFCSSPCPAQSPALHA